MYEYQNKIGMTEPLVDAEGYPRADVNVYQVRHARHKIICKSQCFLSSVYVNTYVHVCLKFRFAKRFQIVNKRN